MSYSWKASMTSGISLSASCRQKGLPRHILCLQGLSCRGGSAPDRGGRANFKYCNTAFQGNQGMDFEPKISLFFGWAPSIICTVCTEGTAVPRPSKLTDRKGESVSHKITAGRHGERLEQFLPEQRPSGSVELGTAAESGKKVSVITFYKGISCIFRIHPNQLAADA